jgi:hypothetical protein
MNPSTDVDKETRVVAEAIAEARRLVADDSRAHLAALESVVGVACRRISDNPPADRERAVARLKELVRELDALADELARRRGPGGRSRDADAAAGPSA